MNNYYTSNMLRQSNSAALLNMIEANAAASLGLDPNSNGQILSLSDMFGKAITGLNNTLNNIATNSKVENLSHASNEKVNSQLIKDENEINPSGYSREYEASSQSSTIDVNSLNLLNQQMQNMSVILDKLASKINYTVSQGVIQERLTLPELRDLVNKLSLNGLLTEQQESNLQELIALNIPIDRLVKSLFDPANGEPFRAFEEVNEEGNTDLGKLSAAVAASQELGEQVGEVIRKTKNLSATASENNNAPLEFKVRSWYLVTFVNAAAIMQQNVATFVTTKNEQITSMQTIQKYVQTYISYVNGYFSALNQVFTNINSVTSFLGTSVSVLNFSLSDAQLTNYKNSIDVQFINQEVFSTGSGTKPSATGARTYLKFASDSKTIGYGPDTLLTASSPNVIMQSTRYHNHANTNWATAGLATPYIYALLSNQYAAFDFGKNSGYGQNSINSIFDALGLNSSSIDNLSPSQIYNNTAVLKNYNGVNIPINEMDPGGNIAFITNFEGVATINGKKTISMDQTLLQFVPSNYLLKTDSTVITSQLVGGKNEGRGINNTYQIGQDTYDGDQPLAYMSIGALKEMSGTIFSIASLYYNVAGDDEIIKNLGTLTDANNQLNTINNFTQSFNDQIQNQVSYVQTSLQQLSQFMQNVLQFINSAFNGM